MDIRRFATPGPESLANVVTQSTLFHIQLRLVILSSKFNDVMLPHLWCRASEFDFWSRIDLHLRLLTATSYIKLIPEAFYLFTPNLSVLFTIESRSMRDLFRETAYGRIIRLVSRGALFAYEEELDPSKIRKEYFPIESECSSRVFPETDGTPPEKDDSNTDSEKGSDSQLVDWAEHDPQNPRNWSSPKKFFVTFQICLLTTSVYIGSAIYTAGVLDIQQKFHVSEVAALLGLTLFVLGYALGPMVWVGKPSCSFANRN